MAELIILDDGWSMIPEAILMHGLCCTCKILNVPQLWYDNLKCVKLIFHSVCRLYVAGLLKGLLDLLFLSTV